MKSGRSSLFRVASLAAAAGLFSAAALDGAPAARVSLFDGKTLAGWKLVTCDAVVQDGAILLRGGNGLVQSAQQYSDYTLEFEWKCLKAEKWDSGIYFRYDTMPPKRPWPLRYQVNLRQGEEGNLVGLASKPCHGLFKDRQWNRLKLTVRGSQVALEVNGTPAWVVDGLEGAGKGYIGLQSEVPGGGQHLFRNIYITEL
jgi:hypothetical protein